MDALRPVSRTPQRLPGCCVLIDATGESPMRRKTSSRRSVRASARIKAQHDAALGRRATRPGDIPWRGWWQVIRRTYLEIISDRISLVAAGCAFYATLALFPAINMMI